MREYLKFEDIKETIKPILKEGVKNEFISPVGNVYKYTPSRNEYLKRKIRVNEHNGYVYTPITFPDGNKNRRVHRLVATAFIDNPNNYDVVGHKNNIKHDNRVENLYWTTVSENTQKAVDDGLLINDIGIQDSQSIPIACFKNGGELVSVYGSMSEAGRCIKGSSKSSIAKVVDKTENGRKGYYYKSITVDEFISNTGKKNLKFEMKSIPKKRREFKAISPMGEVYFSDNQSAFAREHSLSQANISHQVRKSKGGYYKDWFFKEV